MFFSPSLSTRCWKATTFLHPLSRGFYCNLPIITASFTRYTTWLLFCSHILQIIHRDTMATIKSILAGITFTDVFIICIMGLILLMYISVATTVKSNIWRADRQPFQTLWIFVVGMVFYKLVHTKEAPNRGEQDQDRRRPCILMIGLCAFISRSRLNFLLIFLLIFLMLLPHHHYNPLSLPMLKNG